MTKLQKAKERANPYEEIGRALGTIAAELVNLMQRAREHERALAALAAAQRKGR